MLQYIVFLWLTYEPASGWNDALRDEHDNVRSFATQDEACAAARAAFALMSHGIDEHQYSYQVVDLAAGKIVEEYGRYNTQARPAQSR